MALNAYLTLTGKNNVRIEGSVTMKGREKTIAVIAVQHEVLSTVSNTGGGAVGKIQHKQFIITKEVDKSSPKLYEALINGDILPYFELRFYAPAKTSNAGGVEVNHYTVNLTNVMVADIKMVMPNNKNPELMNYKEYEEVGFIYQKIEWVWNDGKISTVATV